MSAIRAVGREATGGENKFENVGIGVSANPAQKIDLEIALEGIGKKGCELEGAKLELDADAAPLLLKGGADEAVLLVGGSFQGKVETDPILLARETGAVKELFSARGIERVLRNVRFERPVIGRENTRGHAGLSRGAGSG